MKIKCEKCRKEINKKVDRAFEEFSSGRVICPHCKARQRRYLSEIDLLVYFGLATTLYFVMVTLVYLMFNFVALDALIIGVIIGLLVINFFIAYRIDHHCIN